MTIKGGFKKIWVIFVKTLISHEQWFAGTREGKVNISAYIQEKKYHKQP